MFPTLCNTHNIKELTTTICCEHRLSDLPQTFLHMQSVFLFVKMNPKRLIAATFPISVETPGKNGTLHFYVSNTPCEQRHWFRAKYLS